MKKTLLSILFYITLNVNLTAHVDHYKNYNYLEYELFRNNQLIGFHKYDFQRNKGDLTVESEVEFKISKLNIDLYKYKAISTENYEKNVFSSFSSKTIQNKKEKYVKINLNKDENKLFIDGSSYKGDADINYMVGTWWNHEIVKAKAQISAISGRIIDQKVTFKGKEKININGKNYNALRFNFSSSDINLPDNKKLNTEIWYEEKTYLWLKAAFDKRGYWEYRLKEVR